MTDAEHAVQEVAVNIPTEVSARFEATGQLSDEDRKTIIEIASKSLARFLPKPETKAEPEGMSKADTQMDVKPVPATDAKPSPTLKARP
jgi:hypothetical protein